MGGRVRSITGWGFGRAVPCALEPWAAVPGGLQQYSSGKRYGENIHVVPYPLGPWAKGL